MTLIIDQNRSPSYLKSVSFEDCSKTKGINQLAQSIIQLSPVGPPSAPSLSSIPLSPNGGPLLAQSIIQLSPVGSSLAPSLSSIPPSPKGGPLLAQSIIHLSPVGSPLAPLLSPTLFNS